jgi:hypothetical protein
MPTFCAALSPQAAMSSLSSDVIAKAATAASPAAGARAGHTRDEFDDHRPSRAGQIVE